MTSGAIAVIEQKFCNALADIAQPDNCNFGFIHAAALLLFAVAGQTSERFVQLAARGERVRDIEPYNFAGRIEHKRAWQDIFADECEGFAVFIEKVWKLRP